MPTIFSYCPTPSNEWPPKAITRSVISTLVMRACTGAAKAAATAAASSTFFFIGVSLVQFLARKARGVVRIADAVIDGFLRVRALRPGTRHTGHGARADDAVRRDALLHPLDERRQP